VKRILVVEDNETNLYLIRFMLNKSGYEVIEAMEGQTGVELAAKEKPDLILMDIQLPDIDGLEATRRIRNAEGGMRNKIEEGPYSKSEIPDPKSKIKKIPIIALTSYAMVGDREKALEAGCTGYIEKPINPDTFIADMEKNLMNT
jgi:CheY-like chemotaxis protein